MPHQCTECGHVFPDGSKEMLSGCPECGGTKFQFHPGEVPDDPGDADPPERDQSHSRVTEAVGRAADTVRGFVGTEDGRPGAPSSDDQSGTGAPSSAGQSGTGDADAGTPSASSPQNDTSAEQSTADADLGSDREWPETARPADTEDSAQADARSSVVDEDELPPVEERDPIGPAADDAPAPTQAASGESAPDPNRTPTGDDAAEVPDKPDIAELREELNDQFESIRIVEPGQYELNLMELYDRDEYIIALQENGRYVIEVPDAWRDDE